MPMTVHVVVVDPPRPGLVLPDLVDAGVLSAANAADLYTAMVKDTVMNIAASGGELLVNYRPTEHLPAEFQSTADPESEVEAVVMDALGGSADVRFEEQVGSTHAGRVGNTVTHLLEEEDADSVAVLDGTAPTLHRTTLDSGAMKLRRHETVLAPGPGGRITYLGLTDPIDFTEAFTPPELGTLVDRAREAGHSIDFLPMQPAVKTANDLASLVTILRAKAAADRIVSEHTLAAINDLDLRVSSDGTLTGD